MGYTATSVVIWGINIDVPIKVNTEEMNTKYYDGMGARYLSKPEFDKIFLEKIFKKLKIDDKDKVKKCLKWRIAKTPYYIYSLEKEPSEKSPWFIVLKMNSMNDHKRNGDITKVTMPTYDEINKFNQWIESVGLDGKCEFFQTFQHDYY